MNKRRIVKNLQIIHRTIWERVRDDGDKFDTFCNAKPNAIEKLSLDAKLKEKIVYYNACVFCMAFNFSCHLCPLYACEVRNSLYWKIKHAFYYDEEKFRKYCERMMRMADKLKEKKYKESVIFDGLECFDFDLS